MPEVTLIERAFQLAKAGGCKDLEQLRIQLKGEGYSNIEAHMSGVYTKSQLRTLMAAN